MRCERCEEDEKIMKNPIGLFPLSLLEHTCNHEVEFSKEFMDRQNEISLLTMIL